MINIKNPSDCCGCTACASICAHNAITMKPDTLGFLYPIVDKEKCVDCGLCEKVCAFNDNYDTSLNLEEPLAYAARHKNLEELRYSRSGAVFIAFSDYILNQGGVVYGAGYADHFRVVHKRATTKEERDEFKGSKYVQSDMNTIFRQVKKDLREGMCVLFSGTPCQTAGLNSYVGKKLRENLYLLDIVCHGVPSPFIWRDYVDYIEKKNKSKIKFLEFRDKSIGWYQPHQESFVLQNNKRVVDFLLRYLFYSGLVSRPSCERCHYCNLNRPSDISIGDFWGYERSVPEMNSDNKGISLVICNTKKGQELFMNSKSSLWNKSVNLDESLQPNLQHPSIPNPKWEAFQRDYCNCGFMYVIKKYGTKSFAFRLKGFIKGLLKKIKKTIK